MFTPSRTINNNLSRGNGKCPKLSEMSVKRAFESPQKPPTSSDDANQNLRSKLYFVSIFQFFEYLKASVMFWKSQNEKPRSGFFDREVAKRHRKVSHINLFNILARTRENDALEK